MSSATDRRFVLRLIGPLSIVVGLGFFVAGVACLIDGEINQRGKAAPLTRKEQPKEFHQAVGRVLFPGVICLVIGIGITLIVWPPSTKQAP